MKPMKLKRYGFAIVILIIAVNSFGQECESQIGCDLKKYDPVIVSHALLNAVEKQVQPTYPPAAKSVGASGEVEVQIIVNRSGSVIATCVICGHPLLRNSAEEAAIKWKFKKNFGYIYRQKRKYILSSLIFKFELPT